MYDSRRYPWKLIERPMINDFADRHHPFEGCFNFRDIGGYPAAGGRTVRWGYYFRAGRQDRMTEQDLEQVKELGISTQIDLRRPWTEKQEALLSAIEVLQRANYRFVTLAQAADELLG